MSQEKIFMSKAGFGCIPYSFISLCAKTKVCGVFMKLIMLSLCLILVGCSPTKTINTNLPTISINSTSKENETEKVILRLYFPNKDASKLEEEKRFIKPPENIEQASKIVIDKLIEGPISNGLISILPTDTKKPDITLYGDTVVVNFPLDFAEKCQGGSTSETFIVESIVKSLRCINGIKGVKFTIDGKQEKEFKGHLDFSQTFK